MAEKQDERSGAETFDDAFWSAFCDSLDSLGIDLRSEEELERLIQHALEVSLPSMTTAVADSLKARSAETLEEHRALADGFQARLRETWGCALDGLEILLIGAREAGGICNEAYRQEAVEDGDLTFDVLTRLHARACLVCSEIIALLKSGFASGANARWRTLHEIAVVAFFIREHGNELAERYLAHEGIESYKGMRQYMERHDQLGYEPFSKEEIEEMQQVRDGLIDRYGPAFKGQYGWASGYCQNPRPSFADIEQSVTLDLHRPFYKMASHGVHANPKGILFDLGLPDTAEDILLAGPSNTGLADPGQCAAISLCHATVALLIHAPSVEGIVTLRVLMQMADDAREAFMEAHHRVEELCREQRIEP